MLLIAEAFCNEISQVIKKSMSEADQAEMKNICHRLNEQQVAANKP